ncbi:hypothetical protein ABZS77_29605 [Micromonospora sp. NPDC005298]|uniref:hypothetical protein n=1 Tax=Micromonospora sp. NPDC005298 TaxID=3156873 RepID=UPI0033BF5160
MSADRRRGDVPRTSAAEEPYPQPNTEPAQAEESPTRSIYSLADPLRIPVGTRVWLVPKTIGAPAICWTEPRGSWVRYEHPYAVVMVDGVEHQVHERNVRLTDPARRYLAAPPAPKPKPRPEFPDGFDEVPLW